MNSLELIRNGKSDKAFQKLYKNRRKVVAYICKNSGTKADAEDIFQSALFIFHENVRSEAFQLTSSADAYVFSVARNLWYEELRRRGKSLETEEAGLPEVEDYLEKEEKFSAVETVLSRIGEKCRELLLDFYLGEMSMKELMKKAGYSSIQAIKTRKYKCLEQAKKMVEL